MALCIDLFCGLGGWAEGFLAEGWDVIGFDIERHDYGTGGYPGQLVLQDVLTLQGSQFRNADCIVASPPCQAYSYRAMPWKRAKALPPPSNELFEVCFRIQREASEATKQACHHCRATGKFPNCCKCYCCDGKGVRGGRYIPLVVENVKGAQPWVGPARWHFGSYYLWGDVPALMPLQLAKKNSGGSWFAVGNNTRSGLRNNPDGWSVPQEGVKVGGRAYQPGVVVPNGAGKTSWFHGNTKHELRGTSSGSRARKAASAEIAKIPFPLAQHIARVYKPETIASTG